MICDGENNGIPQTGLTLAYTINLSVPALGAFLVELSYRYFKSIISTWSHSRWVVAIKAIIGIWLVLKMFLHLWTC